MRLATFLSLLLLAGCDFKKMQTASIAKEYCSCLYVTKQKPGYCMDIVTHFLHKLRFQSLDVKNNPARRMVTATLGSESVSFGMTTRSLGCKLFPPKHEK
jgi:hypothetical protein